MHADEIDMGKSMIRSVVVPRCEATKQDVKECVIREQKNERHVITKEYLCRNSMMHG